MEHATVTITAGPALFAPERRAVSVAAIALVSMLAFEALAVTAAMPEIARALDGLEQYALAFGATLATSVIGMVAAGSDCDRHGPARSMLAGLLLFAAGLLAAGFASDMHMLVFGRVLQGLGSGAMGVALYVTVGRWYPAELRPRLFALFAAAWVLPAIIGPGLAGLIVEWLGWRWVFLAVALLLPPAAWTFLPAARSLAPSGVAEDTNATRRLCLAVIAALAALALHDYATQAAQRSPLQAGAGFCVLLYACAGLLPAGTLTARRGLPTVIALRGLVAGAFFAAEAFVPLWLTQHGWTIATAGLALSCGGVSWSAGSALQSRISDPVRRHTLLRAGFALLFLALAALTLIAWFDQGLYWVLPTWALAGFGVGMSFPSLSVLMLGLSAEHEQGRHSSALQLSDALATTATLALCGGLYVSLHPWVPSERFAIVLAAAALIALLATALSRRVQPRVAGEQPVGRLP
ncbi:MAG: MFS transporter [Lysobacterales bacterium]